MTKETYEILQQAALKGTMRDDHNPIFIFALTNSELLLQIASGQLDARALARLELMSRGLSFTDGSFIGFKRTEELFISTFVPQP